MWSLNSDLKQFRPGPAAYSFDDKKRSNNNFLVYTKAIGRMTLNDL